MKIRDYYEKYILVVQWLSFVCFAIYSCALLITLIEYTDHMKVSIYISSLIFMIIFISLVLIFSLWDSMHKFVLFMIVIMTVIASLLLLIILYSRLVEYINNHDVKFKIVFSISLLGVISSVFTRYFNSRYTSKLRNIGNETIVSRISIITIDLIILLITISTILIFLFGEYSLILKYISILRMLGYSIILILTLLYTLLRADTFSYVQKSNFLVYYVKLVWPFLIVMNVIYFSIDYFEIKQQLSNDDQYITKIISELISYNIVIILVTILFVYILKILRKKNQDNIESNSNKLSDFKSYLLEHEKIEDYEYYKFSLTKNICEEDNYVPIFMNKHYIAGMNCCNEKKYCLLIPESYFTNNLIIRLKFFNKTDYGMLKTFLNEFFGGNIMFLSLYTKEINLIKYKYSNDSIFNSFYYLTKLEAEEDYKTILKSIYKNISFVNIENELTKENSSINFTPNKIYSINLDFGTGKTTFVSNVITNSMKGEVNNIPISVFANNSTDNLIETIYVQMLKSQSINGLTNKIKYICLSLCLLLFGFASFIGESKAKYYIFILIIVAIYFVIKYNIEIIVRYFFNVKSFTNDVYEKKITEFSREQTYVILLEDLDRIISEDDFETALKNIYQFYIYLETLGLNDHIYVFLNHYPNNYKHLFYNEIDSRQSIDISDTNMYKKEIVNKNFDKIIFDQVKIDTTKQLERLIRITKILDNTLADSDFYEKNMRQIKRMYLNNIEKK